MKTALKNIEMAGMEETKVVERELNELIEATFRMEYELELLFQEQPA